MLIKVKVFPKSKKDEIIGKSPESFEVRVREKPQSGRANEAVVKLLAGYFGVPVSQIRMIKGGREKNKIFRIDE